MEYRLLGHTNLLVSRLCFGTLTIGPLQANLPLSAGASVIRAALEAGVNFIDSARLYRTYPYIREALKNWSKEVIIATKSYDYTAEGMAESVEEARKSLDRDVIDIFLLHEQESIHTFHGHAPAYEYLMTAKSRGIIRAVGISTHSAKMVETAAHIPEIEVIHPLYNRRGIGIMDGTAETMKKAIDLAGQAGKGIYGMKALGGGHLYQTAGEEFHYVLSHPSIQAVAVGMRNIPEVDMNCAIFSGAMVGEEAMRAVRAEPRQIHIETWCCGCGNCVGYCPAKALSLQAGRIVAHMDRCVFCGYCGAHCPNFCIKVI
jgi:aryl-alcohol dehydrogenase-like predicted oxidoreductase